jgi:hypothetical protein
MSEHDETYAGALSAARLFGLRHQTAPTEPQDRSLGVQVLLVDPPHAVRLYVADDRAVRVEVFHHVDREGLQQASEIIRDYKSPRDLETRIEAIYQATLDTS